MNAAGETVASASIAPTLAGVNAVADDPDPEASPRRGGPFAGTRATRLSALCTRRI
jgi:hypothetical protein